MGNACDFGILLGHAFCAVNQYHDHVRAFDRCHGTDNAVALDFFLDFIFAPDACRINQHILLAVIYDLGIDGIACRSCNIRYNHAVFSAELINQGRFSGIRLSDNGNFRAFVFGFFLVPFREIPDDLVKHVAKPEPGSG